MAKLIIDGVEREYDEGIKFEIVAKDYQAQYDDMIALLFENGKIRELTKSVSKDAEIKFITLHDTIGHKTYVRTAIMTLVKSAYDVLSKEDINKIKVEYAIGQGYYIEISLKSGPLTQEQCEKIKERMDTLIEADRPITKRSYPKDEAIKLFKEEGMDDKVNLFRYRRSSSINVYCLDDVYDYFYGYMLPSTGYVKYYDIMQYEDGLMLLIPSRQEPAKIAYFEPREKLFNTLKEADEWGTMMGIETVGDLNGQVCSGMIDDMILVAEAFQERKIGELAKQIVEKGNVKFILIAGPSSSGKTTFSHRLSIQLRTYGKVPHPIAMDNYYVGRAKTPIDEDGKPDYECIEAIDTDQFNEDMTRLLNGERVEMPEYNFKTGEREYNGTYLQLGDEDILVIEGIHGLNPKTSEKLPDESKFKIFISALTALNIDNHNRIPTTDARLLRRLVRDARTRGTVAKKTIAMWPSVRRGEEKYIFPYQETADVMFNSALIYELAALKQYAEPLLFEITKEDPEYHEAKRLLKFLEYFIGLDPRHVPNNSICREFIGGSYFKV